MVAISYFFKQYQVIVEHNVINIALRNKRYLLKISKSIVYHMYILYHCNANYAKIHLFNRCMKIKTMIFIYLRIQLVYFYSLNLIFVCNFDISFELNFELSFL